MSIYYFIFYFKDFDLFKKTEEVKMCKKLDELSNLKLEHLYSMFEEEFSNAPIDIHSILEKLNIDYGAVDFGDIHGIYNGINLPEQAGMVMGAVAAYSEKDDGKDYVEISVNKYDNYHRQRFTLAHELAHCMLHAESLRNGRIELRTALTSDDIKEIEANVLAGEILIPEKLLKTFYKTMPFPFLSFLAKKFDVSENVMKARLQYLKMGYYTI